MLLRQLIAQLKIDKLEGSLDREVIGIAYDSRRVTPGMIFVAIRGQKDDGHQFILSAIDRGAAAIISETSGYSHHRATMIKVADSREALAQLAAVYYQNPSAKLKLVGITGTNGKTTVAFILKQILEAAGIKTGLIGTIRYEIGERMIPAQRTTPESLEIQQMLAQMLRAGCQACVMEVSSHALQQKRICGIQFDVAVFTNLTQDHLDYHKTMEEYFQAKRKLFTAQPDNPKPTAAVINLDDPYGERLAKEATVQGQLVKFSLGKECQVQATQFKLGGESTQITVHTPDRDLSLEVPLIGRHNVYNVLAVVGTGLALGVNLSNIHKTLAKVDPVPGRLERIDMGQPFVVLVDYAHTDDALYNVLGSLREITPGKLLLTFGCGGNRDPGKRAKMGKVAAELADTTIITSDNPRKESAAAIASQIEDGYRAVRQDGCHVEIDRHRAIDELMRSAQPGDTVIIAGKGHETYQEFEDTIVPFDDRLKARQTLQTLGYGQ